MKKIILILGTLLLCSQINMVIPHKVYAENLQCNYYDDGIYDEYLPQNNLNETYEFEDNVVLVQIKHQYSNSNKIWTSKDFGVDNIDYIEDLSITGFRQILSIHLKEKGKDKVLKMIDDLENKNIPAIRCLAVSLYLTDNLSLDNQSINTNTNISHFDAAQITPVQNYTKGNPYIKAGVIEQKVANINEINNIEYPFTATTNDDTHATAVASVLAGKTIGVAPNTTIVSTGQLTTVENMTEAVKYATKNNIPVLNVSVK